MQADVYINEREQQRADTPVGGHWNTPGDFSEMDDTLVWLDSAALQPICEDWIAHHDKKTGAQWSNVMSAASGVPAPALRGTQCVEVWMAESLAVLLGVDARLIYRTDDIRPSKEDDDMGKVVPWTEEEDLILREHAHLGKDGIAALLDARSASSVMNRAHILGISIKKRAVAEDAPTPDPVPRPEPTPQPEADPAPEKTNCAGGSYCPDIDMCRTHLSSTPCGADPCELVRCEGCGVPAPYTDTEGVPLCAQCMRETIVDNVGDDLRQAGIPEDVIGGMLDVMECDLEDRFPDPDKGDQRAYPEQVEGVGSSMAAHTSGITVTLVAPNSMRDELIATYARLAIAQIQAHDTFDEAETIDVLDRIKELAS